jgi:hypothetical protein
LSASVPAAVELPSKAVSAWERRLGAAWVPPSLSASAVVVSVPLSVAALARAFRMGSVKGLEVALAPAMVVASAQAWARVSHMDPV